MAEEISHPHDSMVRAVLGDVAEARSFLRRYVPEELSQTLNWSTLRLREGSFVDEELRRSEVVELISTLSSLPPGGGINYIRVFLRYILQTQDREAIESFQEVLQRRAPHLRGDLMTYAQELLKEGENKAEVRIIENLLREGLDWAAIERVTGVGEAQFEALKRQVEEMSE
jgi:predicted transposase YdaD